MNRRQSHHAPLIMYNLIGRWRPRRVATAGYSSKPILARYVKGGHFDKTLIVLLLRIIKVSVKIGTFIVMKANRWAKKALPHPPPTTTPNPNPPLISRVSGLCKTYHVHYLHRCFHITLYKHTSLLNASVHNFLYASFNTGAGSICQIRRIVCI